MIKAFAYDCPTDEKGFDWSLLPLFYQQVAKETQGRSLMRGKKSFLSQGSLISMKDNFASESIGPGSDGCSSSSHHMNHILKAPQERVPGQRSSLEKIVGGEPKATVTVGRSATVAGDMKVLCCFGSIISNLL